VEAERAETWATIIGSVKALFDMNVPSGLRVALDSYLSWIFKGTRLPTGS
jgi:hypothetical protein